MKSYLQCDKLSPKLRVWYLSCLKVRSEFGIRPNPWFFQLLYKASSCNYLYSSFDLESMDSFRITYCVPIVYILDTSHMHIWYLCKVSYLSKLRKTIQILLENTQDTCAVPPNMRGRHIALYCKCHWWMVNVIAHGVNIKIWSRC